MQIASTAMIIWHPVRFTNVPLEATSAIQVGTLAIHLLMKVWRKIDGPRGMTKPNKNADCDHETCG